MPSPESPAKFAPPLRFLSFESRRAEEMRSLILRFGGEPTVAPSLREVPLSENTAALRFGDDLFAGRIDVVVFLTGVGAETLLDVLNAAHEPSAVIAALERTTVVVRSPKSAAVLKRRGVRIDHKAPEPNTWREVAAVIREAIDLHGKTVAVQEYGKANAELYDELSRLGAKVTPVPVYRWALPDDTRPLEQAIQAAAACAFDIYGFTSAQQVENVLSVAARLGVSQQFASAVASAVLVSIGPTCSEALIGHGMKPDLEASPPKMGPMIRLAIERANSILALKRGDETV